jgi:hypothetical protein
VVVVDVGPPGAVVGTPGVVSGIGDSAPGSAAGEFGPIAAPGGAIDPTAVAPVETVPVVWAKAQAGVNAASRTSGRIVMASLLDFPGSTRGDRPGCATAGIAMRKRTDPTVFCDAHPVIAIRVVGEIYPV